MASHKPLWELLAQCEEWCAHRNETEYAAVAAKGVAASPQHYPELDSAFPGQTPGGDGWILHSGAIGLGSWILLGLAIGAGWMLALVSVFRSVENTEHPFLYALLLWIVPAGLIALLPLRLLLRSHELVFGKRALHVKRRIFGRIEREWKLEVAGDVRVALAYRGARARRYSSSGVKYAQLSIVVMSCSREIVFGDDLDYRERARIALLIDHHYRRGPDV